MGVNIAMPLSPLYGKAAIGEASELLTRRTRVLQVRILPFPLGR